MKQVVERFSDKIYEIVRKFFRIDVDEINKRIDRGEKQQFIFQPHYNTMQFKYFFTRRTKNNRYPSNFHLIRPNFVLNKNEIPIADIRVKKLVMDEFIVIKPMFFPRSKILGDEFLLKQTLNDEVIYKVGSVFLTSSQYNIYQDYKNNSVSKRNMEKGTDEYHKYIQNRKSFKNIMKLVNGNKKIHSRHFFGTGETLVLFKVNIGILTFYVSLIHVDILNYYYDKYLENKDKDNTTNYWKNDKLVKILEKQGLARSQNLLDEMIMSVNDFLSFLKNVKKKVIVLGPNIEVLNMCKILQLSKDREVLILRKRRNPYILLSYKLLKWDTTVLVVVRNYNSYNYTAKLINIKFGDIDLGDLVEHIQKVRTINDYKYKMLLAQYYLGVELLPLIVTKNTTLVTQINSVLTKYRSIHKHIDCNISFNNQEVSDEFSKILDVEQFHADMLELIHITKPLLHDVIAGHRKAIYLKPLFQSKNRVEDYFRLMDQKKIILKENIEGIVEEFL